MKRLFALTMVILMAVSASFAQEDVKAKKILESTQKKMGTLKTLKTGFTLKLIGKNGKVQDTKKGNFLMKGDKYHITIPGQEIISDGKTVWTYMKDANEVQVSDNNPTEQTLSPAKLFTNTYDKDYNYRYLASRKVAGKTCDVIELKPLKAGQFNKIELAVDKNGSITGGNIFEKNGNQYQYEVNAFTPNATLVDSQFTFDAKAHPKVEVVDLR